MEQWYSSRSLFSRTVFMTFVIVAVVAWASVASAHTSRIVFTVNGDTTAVAMTQGDSLAWGADCAVGAMTQWEIWYDVNSNLSIDAGTDVMVTAYTQLDGDTSSDVGLPDINPVPDGFYQTPNLLAGIADGMYIFRVTDYDDNSVVTKSFAVEPLGAAPNSFSGTMVVPGHPAPDPAILGNKWVQADIEDDNQIWSDFSNDSGKFHINVGAAGTGLTFKVSPPDIPGYVTPSRPTVVASGHITLPNFVYVAATDSVFGTVKDDLGASLSGMNAFAQSQFGNNHKDSPVESGHYKFYFGPSERGVWWIGLSRESLIPQYMVPSQFSIDNTSNHSIQHNIVCLTADTTIFVRVTENGGLPSHPYHIQAGEATDFNYTEGYTGTGASNVATLHVSHLYDTGWYAQIVTWDTLYPIPPQLIPDGSGNHSIGLGDTLTINLVSGYKVSDTIKVDPGDPLPHWDSVWVGLCNLEGCQIAKFDSGGVFTAYGDTGEYTLGVFAPMYLADPTSIDLHLQHDTVGGMSFTLNRTHCRITGALINVPLPLLSPTWIIGFEESGSGLTTSTEVDPMTGSYSLYLSDGEWSIAPPSIPGRVAPAGAFLTIAEAPDSLRMQNFIYTTSSGVDDNPAGDLPAHFALGQNYPNPFNPSTVISFDLPVRSDVKLVVYNLLGQPITTLVSDVLPAGSHQAEWNGHSSAGHEVASGVYFYKLTAGDFVDTKKMVYLK